MSASLPKMSNIINSNGLCYYKVPLNYTSTTDLRKYAFTVASKELDTEYNTHIFDASEYIPNCRPQNDQRSLYKPIAIISGTQDVPYTNNIGVSITAPLAGLVKNANLSSKIFFDDASRIPSGREELLNNVSIAGFDEDSIIFGTYKDLRDTIRSSGLYSGAVTGYIDVNNSKPSDYWTFIAIAASYTNEGEISDGYYMIGATSVEMALNDIYTQAKKEVNNESFTVLVVPLSHGNAAQMYNVNGSQYIIPSQLPVQYQLHTDLISNAVVLWEKVVAYIPPYYNAAPKNADSIQVDLTTSVKQLNCYVQPSESSALIGSHTVDNKYFKYYDIATSYDASGNLELWFRLGDPKEDNNCWMKFVNKRTIPKVQASFYFRLNRDVENFDAFNWQYAVVTNANNAKYEKNNSFINTGNWHDFTFNVDENLSNFVPNTVDADGDPTGAPGTNDNHNLNTWVSTSDSYNWLYIKATTNDDNKLLPYQVSYLQSDEHVDYTYQGVTSTGEYYYIFRYKVDAASEYEFVNSQGTTESTPISKSNFSNIEISPIIRDNRVHVIGSIVYVNPPGNIQYRPDQVGSIVFKQVMADDSEIDVPGDVFPRGATIKAYARTRNGWNFDGFDGGNTIELPVNNTYEIYVVKGKFSKKNNPITLIIENSDTAEGDIDIEIMGIKDTSNWVKNGNKATKSISTFEGLELTLTAKPKMAETSEGKFNTGDLARWEYFYNKNPADLSTGEWRLLNDKINNTFEIKLWQTSGGNNTHKDIYKYRAIWGRKCILY